MDRTKFIGSLSCLLLASMSDENKCRANEQQSDRCGLDSRELSNHSRPHSDGNNSDKEKQGATSPSNWKGKIKLFFLWAGNRSLEIYLIHDMVLNIFRSETSVQFNSIEGYLLTAGNFVLTIALCSLIINLLSHNSILKRVLGVR